MERFLHDGTQRYRPKYNTAYGGRTGRPGQLTPQGRGAMFGLVCHVGATERNRIVNQSNRGAMLCPGCGKLISRSAEQCPFCRLRNPHAGARPARLMKTLGGNRGAIRTIIYANGALFILSILLYPRHIQFSMNPLFFLSVDIDSLLLLGGTGTVPIDTLYRWWTLVSANYLHGSLLHLFFNMAAFHQLGTFVEREFGTSRMFIIYTCGGAIGFLVSYAAGIKFTIGASAAVCAMMGAGLYYGKSRGGAYGAAVYRQIGGWAITLFIFGFVVSGINNWAHGGGLVAGILGGWLLGYSERRRETVLHRRLAMLCLLVTAGILVWAVGSGLYYRIFN